MLGNDVVDLRASDVLRHERFDARVFDDAERDAIAASRDPERTRWMLWAAKESAFKAIRRLDRRVTFTPLRFAVTPRLEMRAASAWTYVAYERRGVCVQIESGDAFLHAIAWTDAVAVATTLHAVARADAVAPGATLHEAVRALARKAVAQSLQLAASEIEIARDCRIPRLVLRGATLPAALSLSHDGSFVAFACQIAQTAMGRLS